MADLLITKLPTVAKYISQACSPLLKWYYTEERLKQFLILDVRSSGEAIGYQFCTQEGSCDLMATNLSPFNFTIDRIEVRVVLEKGGSFTCMDQFPQLVKGASRQPIFLRSRSPMTPEVAKLTKDSKKADISIEAHVLSDIRSFRASLHIRDIKQIHVNL